MIAAILRGLVMMLPAGVRERVIWEMVAAHGVERFEDRLDAHWQELNNDTEE